MPIDASIYNLANKPTVALMTPDQVQMQQLNMSNAMMQNQNMQNQMDQTQRQQNMAQAMQGELSNTDGSPEQVAPVLSKYGQYEAAQKMLAAGQDVASKKAQVQKTYLESSDLEQKQIKGLTAAVGNAAQAANEVEDPSEKSNAWQMALPQLAQQIAPTPQDTPKIAAIKQSMIQQMKQEYQAVQGISDPAQLTSILQKHIDDAKTHEDWMKEAEKANAASLPQSPMGKLAADLANGVIDQATYNKGMAKETHIAPSTNVTISTPMSPQQAQSAFPPDPARPWRTNAAFANIATTNGTLASNVDAALNNDYKFGGNRSIAQDRLVEQAARTIDPNWRQGNYDLKQKMLGDPQVVAANAAVMHLKDFMDDYKQLSPQTASVLLNTPVNRWTTLVNGNSKDAAVLKQLQTTAMSVAGEYGKALGGSDAQASEQARQSLFDPSTTQGQLGGVTGAVGTLLQRTINAKENITRRSAPNSQPLTLLDPDTQDAIKSLGISYSPGGRGVASPAGGPPRFNSPNDPGFSDLPPGTQFVGSDGVVRVKH